MEERLGTFDAMQAIAQLTTKHIERMRDMDVGCSEMFITKPVSATFQVFKLNDEHYVTTEEVLPYSWCGGAFIRNAIMTAGDPKRPRPRTTTPG